PLQPLQSGQQRAGVDLEDPPRDLLDPAADAEAVQRLKTQSLQNQHLESALNDVGIGLVHAGNDSALPLDGQDVSVKITYPTVARLFVVERRSSAARCASRTIQPLAGPEGSPEVTPRKGAFFMSISKAASHRAPSSVGLGVLLFVFAGGVFAQASEPIKVRGRVLPLQGASAPPSSAVIELRPAFLSFAARRAAFGGDEPPVVASAQAVGDGTFALSVPAPGCYSVTFRARGFRTLEIPLLPLVEPIELPPIVPAGLRPLS